VKKVKRQRSTLSKVGCLCAIVIIGTIVPFVLSLQLASLSPYLPFLVIIPTFVIGWFLVVAMLLEQRGRSTGEKFVLRLAFFTPFLLSLTGALIGAALADQQITESGDKLNVHPH